MTGAGAIRDVAHLTLTEIATEDVVGSMTVEHLAVETTPQAVGVMTVVRLGDRIVSVVKIAQEDGIRHELMNEGRAGLLVSVIGAVHDELNSRMSRRVELRAAKN
jgi:hypothetical protein